MDISHKYQKHIAHSLHVTRGQGVEVKVKATSFCPQAALDDPIPAADIRFTVDVLEVYS